MSEAVMELAQSYRNLSDFGKVAFWAEVDKIDTTTGYSDRELYEMAMESKAEGGFYSEEEVKKILGVG
jgi:hypothetical protein